MNYIKKHWAGEHSLAVAFWVNFVFINIISVMVATVFAEKASQYHPQVMTVLFLVSLMVSLLVVYPWQVVGLWRTCTRYVEAGRSRVGPRLAQTVVVLGAINLVVSLNTLGPFVQELVHTTFVPSPDEAYKISYLPEDKAIHFRGGMGFGATKEIEALLEQHPETTTLVLNSHGGRIYEGEALARVIQAHQLDTYTTVGCASACTIAYIAGKHRYLREGATLGFHAYSNVLEEFTGGETMEDTQEAHKTLFSQQGVSGDFLAQMFLTSGEDLWVPDSHRLVVSGVVHDVVSVPTGQDPLSVEDYLEARMQEVLTPALDKDPGIARSEALMESSRQYTQSILDQKDSQTAKQASAANIFFGYYLVNMRERPLFCQARGVEITSFTQAFGQSHQAVLQQAIRASGYTPDQVEQMYRMLKPQMEKVIRMDMEDVADATNTTLTGACEVIENSAERLVPEMHFSRMQPNVYQTLMDNHP